MFTQSQTRPETNMFLFVIRRTRTHTRTRCGTHTRTNLHTLLFFLLFFFVFQSIPLNFSKIIAVRRSINRSLIFVAVLLLVLLSVEYSVEWFCCSVESLTFACVYLCCYYCCCPFVLWPLIHVCGYLDFLFTLIRLSFIICFCDTHSTKNLCTNGFFRSFFSSIRSVFSIFGGFFCFIRFPLNRFCSTLILFYVRAIPCHSFARIPTIEIEWIAP